MRGEYDKARRLDKVDRSYWEGESAQSLLEEHEDYKKLSRSVRGIVRDEAGVAVSGATVVCGEHVVADGKYLDSSWSARNEALTRRRVTQSKADGRFHCVETSAKDLVVVAEHRSLGRSLLAAVPAAAAPEEVELTLHHSGILAGTVTKNGQPAEPQAVQALPASVDMSDPTHVIVTFMRPDGSYRFEGLAPGKYTVFTGERSSDHKLSVQSKEVEVLSRSGATLDFDQSGGDASLLVTVRGKGGVAMPSAQLLLVPGDAESDNAKDFNAKIAAKAIDIQIHLVNGGEELRIDSVKAGLYSICVVPLGGDYRDPEYMKVFSQESMRESLEKIPVYCEQVTIAAGETKSVERAVPAWQPLIQIEKSATATE